MSKGKIGFDEQRLNRLVLGEGGGRIFWEIAKEWRRKTQGKAAFLEKRKKAENAKATTFSEAKHYWV